MLRRLKPACLVSDERKPIAKGVDECGFGSVHFLVEIAQLKLESAAGFTQACEMAKAGAKRVLVVDDDTAVLRIMRETLQNFLHWEVDTSPKPEYAFELALKKDYDLMIFDFSMPLIDGTLLFLLISKVYENVSPVRTVPPLLVVSGQGADARAQELLKEARVCGFLAKPFTINRFLQKVTEVFPEIQSLT